MQGYLLDTHVLLWLRLQHKSLSTSTLNLLETTGSPVYYSLINVWEIVIKEAKGKLSLPEDFFTHLPHIGLDALPLKSSHIEVLRTLNNNHGDPFDRMLVAQAISEGLTFITADQKLTDYPVKILAP